jgi:hypothetical protein
MKMKRNGLATILLTLSLSACMGGTKTEYAGRYTLKSGNECVNTEASNDLFIEVTKTGEEGAYQAKMPAIAAQGFPIFSNEVAPSVQSLSFTFYKEGVSKLIGGSPSIELVVKVVPHPSLKRYLIITEWYANVSRNNQTQKVDFLDETSNDKTVIQYNTGSLTGLCIGE